MMNAAIARNANNEKKIVIRFSFELHCSVLTRYQCAGARCLPPKGALADIGLCPGQQRVARSFVLSDTSTVQDLLGHADVASTMVFTHVLNVGGGRSPVDAMDPVGGPAGAAGTD
jgi:hypothetical protein